MEMLIITTFDGAPLGWSGVRVSLWRTSVTVLSSGMADGQTSSEKFVYCRKCLLLKALPRNKS